MYSWLMSIGIDDAILLPLSLSLFSFKRYVKYNNLEMFIRIRKVDVVLQSSKYNKLYCNVYVCVNCVYVCVNNVTKVVHVKAICAI